ncbi:endoplasmic reticulum-Golgi intermediate compartment protein 3 [Artemisia annua]|uniref:Endoplasmic reticulum-Golgi intermediate compartment protein 3 n=1 Tax=Artemisia annua TaxID=35608 RepID=A0A2U1KV13_ARTAN|nr:endoplasmic reticulum-Golgi intermediate compartment protein 3 [Artemisia annua]
MCYFFGLQLQMSITTFTVPYCHLLFDVDVAADVGGGSSSSSFPVVNPGMVVDADIHVTFRSPCPIAPNDCPLISSNFGMQLEPPIVRPMTIVRPQDGISPSTRPSTSSSAAQSRHIAPWRRQTRATAGAPVPEEGHRARQIDLMCRRLFNSQRLKIRCRHGVTGERDRQLLVVEENFLSESEPTNYPYQIRGCIESGMRVAIYGSVGSRKSSFLYCILGQILKVNDKDAPHVKKFLRAKGWAFLDPDSIDQCKREGFLQSIKDEACQGCKIYGFLDVNKLAANFHFAQEKSFQESSEAIDFRFG